MTPPKASWHCAAGPARGSTSSPSPHGGAGACYALLGMKYIEVTSPGTATAQTRSVSRDRASLLPTTTSKQNFFHSISLPTLRGTTASSPKSTKHHPKPAPRTDKAASYTQQTFLRQELQVTQWSRRGFDRPRGQGWSGGRPATTAPSPTLGCVVAAHDGDAPG